MPPANERVRGPEKSKESTRLKSAGDQGESGAILDSIDDVISTIPSRKQERSTARGWLILLGTFLIITSLAAVALWKSDLLMPAIDRFFGQETTSTEEAGNAPATETSETAGESEFAVSTTSVGSQIAEAALAAAVAANRDLQNQLKALSAQIADLTQQKATLNDNFSLRSQSMNREKEALLARIAELEKKAGPDHDEIAAERDRLLAANENLERQNFLLKGRLSSALLDSTDLPPGQNAEKALQLGSAQVDLLNSRIAELEALLAGAGDERNFLAQSLTEAQSTKAAKSLVTSLNASSGDRLLTDVSERMEALKRQAEESGKKHQADREQWEREKSELTAIRQTLQQQIGELKKQVASLSERNGAFPASAKPNLPSQLPTEKDSSKTSQPSLLPDASSSGGGLVYLPNATELSPPASLLFATLRKLSDDDPTAVAATYQRLENEKQAEPLLTVSFGRGSNWVNREFQTRIESLVAEADNPAATAENVSGPGQSRPRPHFLVIGYASTDGSADSNRLISSARARRVAELLSEKNPSIPVEAVYFGQTERFDSSNPSPNRIVEIWRLPQD